MNTRDCPAPPDTAPVCPPQRSRSPAVQRRRTAVHARRESYTGHPQVRQRRGGPGTTSSRPGTRRGASDQQLRNRPSTATTPGGRSLPERTPSYNLKTRDNATHSTNACRSGKLAGKASTCPAHAVDTQRIWASLSGP